MRGRDYCGAWAAVTCAMVMLVVAALVALAGIVAMRK